MQRNRTEVLTFLCPKNTEHLGHKRPYRFTINDINMANSKPDKQSKGVARELPKRVYSSDGGTDQSGADRGVRD